MADEATTNEPTEEITEADRKRALGKCLDMDTEAKDEDGLTEADRDIDEERDNAFSVGRKEYLVLTDEEADEAAKEYIRDSAWAFNTSFILAHSKAGYAGEKALKEFQQEKCEDANDFVLALITDFDHFANDAIRADGRGHFLAGYDGNEDEQHIKCDDGRERWFFIYRRN